MPQELIMKVLFIVIQIDYSVKFYDKNKTGVC